MNKKLIRIAGWAICLSMMAAGVGASVGSALSPKGNEISQVKADTQTGTINFGSASGSTNVNSASVTGDDSLENEWTVTTVGTTSFTPNAGYSQIGSSKKPATSITFTTTLPSSRTITAFSAKFGGFGGTAGDITLKVGNTTVGTGVLNEDNDVVVSASDATQSGTVLTVTVTGISKGVKAYYLSYSYVGDSNPTITLDKSSQDVFEGKSFALTADSADLEGTLTWKTSDSSIASISSTTGTTITVTGVAAGSATITAYDSADEENIHASCAVTVNEVIVPTGVSISGDASQISLTEYLTLTAEVTSTSGTPLQDVLWSSSNTSVATVNSEGRVDPVAVGTTTISVAADGYPSVTASFELEVIDPIFKMVTSLDQLEIGDTVAIGAYDEDTAKWYIMGTPSTKAPSSGYTYWTNVDNVTVADGMFDESDLSNATTWTYGYVNDKGATFADQYNDDGYLGAIYSSSKYKAGLSSSRSDNTYWTLDFDANGVFSMNTIASTSVTIDYLYYNSKTPEFTCYSATEHTESELRLFKSAGKGIAATSVTTSSESVSLTAGKTGEITYTVAPSFNTDTVTVSSSDTDIMTVSDNNGTITITAVSAGNANIVFKNSADSTLKSVPVTVNAVVVYDHIVVDASAITKTYTIGDTIDLTGATAVAYVNSDESDDPVDISLETIFSCSPTTANTVSNALEITVTGTYANGDSNNLVDTDTLSVAVNPILATGVTLTYGKTAYEVGATTTPTAIGVTNNDATNQTVTVTSSDPEIINVTNSSTGALEFLASGSATITATANDGSGVYASVTLTSNYIYPIDRYLNPARLSGLDNSYQSGNAVDHAFDGINYESVNVLNLNNKDEEIQFKSSGASLINTTSLGGAIKSIQLGITSGTPIVKVSENGSDYIALTGNNGVYSVTDGNSYPYFYISASETTKLSYIQINMDDAITDDINTFASMFNDSVGDNCATFSASNWSTLQETFDLLTATEKAACVDVTVSDLANDTGTELDKALRRYDNIITNYGLTDFIGRNGGGASANVVTRDHLAANSSNLVLIAAIAGVGLLGVVGGSFLLRRKKED